MSWISSNSLNWLQKLAFQIIKVGSVPRHVAFIMDGNRRFANKTNVDKLEGHVKGFDKLSEVLKWCLDMEITQVTVYAFSIENFKRPEEEVNALLELADQKFQRLLEEEEVLKKEGVNIKVIGDLHRLPQKLHKMIAKAVCVTRGNTKARLTIAFSYTARNEMTEAVKCIVDGVMNDHLYLNDVDTDLFERCLFTGDTIAPDLLIRTSGEVRLSDFMLWQSSCACVYFSPVLWPEFKFWDFLRAVFHYQRSVRVLAKIKENKVEDLYTNGRVEKFIDKLYDDRYKTLKNIAYKEEGMK